MSKLLVAAAATAAALVASGTVFAQPELGFATTDEQEELVERITEMQAEGGPTPVGLIDLWHDLALLYEAAGNHALAIVALEEARYVTRIHRGLSSADEALLMQQQIRSEKARGADERVWNLEQDMVTIARQHHDDIRMVPIFRELADDRVDALEEYFSGGFPPEIELGCYYVPDQRPYDDKRGEVRPPAKHPDAPSHGGCRSGDRWSVMSRLRVEILGYYADAIEVILNNGDYASGELRDLEKQMFPGWPSSQLARIDVPSPSRFGCRTGGPDIPVWALDELLALELLGTCLEPVIHDGDVPVGANGAIWAHLVRSIAYEIRSDAPAAARANAIAELADWLLVTTPPDRRRYEESDERALELYIRAYREIEQDDEARATIFSPEVPVTLPTYEPNPFASAATTESSRYIDVSFDITKYGGSEQIEILETGRGATRAEERELIRLIEGTNFRPRIVDGKLADAAPIVVRYHLDP